MKIINTYRRSLNDPESIKELKTRGWVVLNNVAPSQELVEKLLSPIGNLIPQYGQKKFWKVEAKVSGQGTSLGDQMLRLHTELAEFQNPPEYVALYVEDTSAEGGAFRLCDLRPFLTQLDQDDVLFFMNEVMTIKAEGEIARLYGEYSYTAPILSVFEDGLRIRLDQHFIDVNGTDRIKQLRDRIMKYSESNTYEQRLPKGTLVIWDNRFVLHGRTAFSGGLRKLWRCCIRTN